MKQTILVDLVADGNHSLNQLSLSFGMFFFCCLRLKAREESAGDKSADEQGERKRAYQVCTPRADSLAHISRQ